MTNHCGNCKACCKLLRIDELAKAPYKWCQHICTAGCGIYPDRPQSCMDFECEWFKSQNQSPNLPASLRPDKCGVVLRMVEDTLIAYANDGANWREGQIGDLLHTLSKRLVVAVVYRDKVWMIRDEIIVGPKVVTEIMTSTDGKSIRVEMPDPVTEFRPEGF